MPLFRLLGDCTLDIFRLLLVHCDVAPDHNVLPVSSFGLYTASVHLILVPSVCHFKFFEKDPFLLRLCPLLFERLSSRVLKIFCTVVDQR